MTESARREDSGTIPPTRYPLFFVLAAGGFVFDAWTKQVVFDDLGLGGESSWVKPLFGGWMTFRFHTTYNEGALWGLGQGWTWLFAALSVVAVIGVVTWLFVFRAAQSAWLTTALGFVMAGTLGNLWDRVGLHLHPVTGEPVHAVRDFMYATFNYGTFHWPVFNFADVFLVTGAIMLVIQSLFFESREAAVTSVETAPTPAGSDSSPSAA